jgi:hypothetical protein
MICLLTTHKNKNTTIMSSQINARSRVLPVGTQVFPIDTVIENVYYTPVMLTRFVIIGSTVEYENFDDVVQNIGMHLFNTPIQGIKGFYYHIGDAVFL